METISRLVLPAIGYPDVVEAHHSQLAPEVGADVAATPAMLDPEVAYRSVGVSQRETVCGLGVRKECGVEIECDIKIAGPIDPP